MSGASDLLRGISALLWVLLALAAFLTIRSGIAGRMPFLSKLGLGTEGVSMEFAAQRLDEAISTQGDAPAVGQVAKRGILSRLQRNSDLLAKARVLWVDDHPENNASIFALLREFGTTIDTPHANDTAIDLLRHNSDYDVIISDVARDAEGSGSDLKGVEFAEAVFQQWGRKTILFSARFNPLTMPGRSVEERLDLAKKVQSTVFGTTGRYDEALHLILDTIERSAA